AQNAHQQVQPSVAVHICKDGASIVATVPLQSGLFGDIRKPPASEIPEQVVPSIQAGEEKVRPAVVVEIACGHSGPVQENPIGGGSLLGDRVRKLESSFGR